MSYASIDGLETLAQMAHIEDSLRIQKMQQVRNNNLTGLCEECDDPIVPARLAVIPNAKYCVACQAIHDGDVSHKLTYKNPYVP